MCTVTLRGIKTEGKKSFPHAQSLQAAYCIYSTSGVFRLLLVLTVAGNIRDNLTMLTCSTTVTADCF